MSTAEPAETVVVLNPISGSASHVEGIRNRAALRGYDVRETRDAGDAVAFASEAAGAGASVVAAAGGDGTLNEVVRGVGQADAFGDVTVGVIPAGTGNNFARNVGITTIDEGFAALESGERRRIDLGMADGRPFVNSCVGGLTADASGETSAELKNRLGVLAYVLTTLRSATAFEGLRLAVTVRDGDGEAEGWSGEAICVLVGNGRRFTARGSDQADMEDGRFDVAIIEDVSTVDLMGDAIVERLLGREALHTTRLRAPTVEITSLDHEQINFSLDGEMVRRRSLALDVRPSTLRMVVGESYEPDPDG